MEENQAPSKLDTSPPLPELNLYKIHLEHLPQLSSGGIYLPILPGLCLSYFIGCISITFKYLQTHPARFHSLQL